MRKSIKKACALALLATSTASVVGTGVVALVDNKNTNNNGTFIFAEELQTADYRVLKVDGSKTTALIGSTFTIPTAKFVLGSTETTLTGSNIKVTSPIGEEVEIDNGKFTVERIGKYSITYTYTEGLGEDAKTYSAVYTVEGQVSENEIVLKDNTQRILPKYVYQSYTGNIYIPTAEVKFAEGVSEVENNITIKVSSPSHQSITVDEATGKLNITSLELGKYTVQYTARTTNGEFLNTVTKEFEVLSDTVFEKEYKKDYKLTLSYSTTTPTSADIGTELTLPTIIGKMGSEETPVYYTITAQLLTKDGLKDVTSETISDGKFTAKKAYTINGTEYDAKNATYEFKYVVKDALGKEASASFSITGVKDTKAPEIVVADAYNKENTADIKDVSYKIQQNYQNGKNVILKAIYAEDKGDTKLSDLTLTRYIRKDNSSSSEKDIYTDADSKDKDIFTKGVVFNRTGELGENQVDGGDLEDGNYVMYYKAVDSQGNETITRFSFKVDSSFIFSAEDKPTIEFKTNFSRSMSSDSTVTFTKPESSATHDDSLNSYVMYKFNNETEWTVLEADDDGKYKLPLNKVVGASSLRLRAVAENDAPMTSSENNGEIVKADSIDSYDGFKYGFDEVEILIRDNKDTQAPDIASIDKLEATYTQNTEITLPTLVVNDDLVDDVNVDIFAKELTSGQELDVINAVVLRSGNTYTIGQAKLNAILAGNYEIIYQITDAGNNIINIYQYTTVTESSVVTEPKFSKLPDAINDGKLELGESVELPIPTLPSDEYEYHINVKGGLAFANKERFTPKKAGTYTIEYTMNKVGETAVLDTKQFVIKVEDTTKPEIFVDWNLNASYDKDSKVLIPVFSANDVSGIDMEESKIVISSKSYSRTIKASEMANELKKYNEHLEDNSKDAGNLYVTLRYNEEYTVTYTAYDKSSNKNVTTLSYSIKVGDMVAPTIDLDDNIIPSKVKLDDKLTIDVSKITITDSKGEVIPTSELKVVVKNTTTGTTIKNNYEDEEGKFEYTITSAGEYTVTFSAEKNGNKREVVRTFTVNEQENNGLETSEIIAIVACCVAVLILAGAVVYMILTKKKIKSYK